MGKSRRRDSEEYDPKREERILDQMKMHKKKRLKTPPAGHFHEPKKPKEKKPEEYLEEYYEEQEKKD